MPAPPAMDRQLRVLMVSDFFYPNTGGVESHTYQLSQCLMARGHKVVVLTHAYGDRAGVRYLTNGLKVYYAPRLPFTQAVTFPTLFGCFSLLRSILIREGINLVHGHQAFSTMAHEAIMHARTMGYPAVFTDHSLFGFADASSILVNKVLKYSLADVHHVICVSHTSKENTVLRACIPPKRVSVIPNAVDASLFEPRSTQRQWHADGCAHPDAVTIVALSRLVYRKGLDLLAAVLPAICHQHPNVQFLIGGDGPKRPLLERVVARHGLEGRVQLVGAVPHEQVRELLVRGRIFLNCSLTEAFCMALVEAAAAGLLVVSTRVGGVPEVLPADMLLLAEPSPDGLIAAVSVALDRVQQCSADPWLQHAAVREMYSWQSIAQRTERVYRQVLHGDARDDSMVGRLRRYHQCGKWFGKICCCITAVDWLYWRWLEWWQPASLFERAPDFFLPTSTQHASG
ncbi:hypothetical protein D9Q98_006127 [Chlorella vulgaris]|uniref:PIGA GPI anchor biosynthesis domain-containing protein n=1 Tax=Chlorella vulgaris TaxID=3077 RepID=A0A9D4Z1K7_CHLVU|nr:hypothetical protein D9Q98_006127 [Chlorella vulgaris]